MGKGESRVDSYTLASTALKRALDDAGLKKDDIDGLCTGGPLPGERASELWGLNPRWSGGGDAAQCIIEAALAVDAGLCTTVALVYGNAQRSMDTAYGGARVTGGAITSYFYYAPWAPHDRCAGAGQGPPVHLYPVGLQPGELREAMTLEVRRADGSDRFEDYSLPVFGPCVSGG